MSADPLNNFFYDTQWRLSQRISPFFQGYTIYFIFKHKKKESDVQSLDTIKLTVSILFIALIIP